MVKVVVGLCALTLLLACTTVDPTDARNEIDEAALRESALALMVKAHLAAMNDGIAWHTLHAVDDSYVLTSLSTHYRIAFDASSQPPQYAVIADHANRISTTFEIDAQADDITTQVWFRTGRRRTIESYVNSGSWSRTFGFRQKIEICVVKGLFLCFEWQVEAGELITVTWDEYLVETQDEVCSYPTTDDDLDVGGTKVCEWRTWNSGPSFRNVIVERG